MISSFRCEYAWLSNFAKCQVHVLDDDGNEIALPTVGHAYVVFKAGNWTQFQDAVAQQNQGIPIQPNEFRALTLGQAKRLGRRVTLRSDWDDIRQSVMLHLLRQKFSCPKLAKKLLATGIQDIIEGNYWHDQYWGECTCPKHIFVPGKNVLGKLLMRVRSELGEAV